MDEFADEFAGELVDELAVSLWISNAAVGKMMPPWAG